MSATKEAYRQIIKTTSIFGSVQVFNVVVSVVRSKLIAILIGPEGMGIAALFNATLNTVSGISGLGIEISGVKHISANYIDGDPNSVAAPISAVRKIAMITGLLGTLVTFFLAPWLSRITFHNDAHTTSFLFLSTTLLLKQLSAGETVILQSLRKIRQLASASLYGNLAGLLISVPLYYYYRIDAIVPALIVASLCAMAFSFLYSRRIRIVKARQHRKDFVRDGKDIVKLGITLTLTGLLPVVVSYLIQLYVSQYGGISNVGFYNAGFTLLNSYVGLLFVAMGADYFPRLSAHIANASKTREIVLQQSLMGILLITPIITIFLMFSKFIVRLLFSADFVVIVPMVCAGILGMLFRVVSYSMGYILLAKADSKLFIATSIGFNVLYLVTSLLGYYFYGLEGFGIAFGAYYFFHFIGLKLITRFKYNFTFDREFVGTYVICIALCFTAFALTFVQNDFVKYALLAAVTATASIFCVIRINKKTALLSFARRLKK